MRENACNIIACLMRGNGTRKTISEMAKVNIRVVDEWLKLLYDAGLIREVRGETPSATWAWQAKPFDKEDFAP